MHQELRRLYNAAYTPALYQRYVSRLESTLGLSIPFRIAETPFFIPRPLRQRLATSAREIVAQISRPSLIEEMKRAIPAHLDAPGIDATASCIQVDFAICRNADGELDGKVVELQGFPSLYALMVFQTEALREELRGIPGLDREYSLYYGGHDRASFVAKLKHALVLDHAPEEVVLLDIDPPNQKTYCDMIATQRLCGVDPIGPEQLEREGNKLFRRKDGRRIQVKRIYNRVVFDELAKVDVKLPFQWNEALDLTWCPHPNWYWIWSKYTLPHVHHPAVPRARYLSELEKIPDDLSNYVLKPLFSFAGTGVKVDVTAEDIAAVPESERGGWILQEKITYVPALHMPDGNGVKAEVRMMFLRGPDDVEPQLVLNLVRLSRGKMIGVDHNRDLDWVGGSIGIWPADEEPV